MVDNNFVVRFPTDAEEERLRRFRVNASYLISLALYLDAMYTRRGSVAVGLLQAQAELGGYQRIQRRALEHPTHSLRRFLTIAWASELQLRLAGQGNEHVLGYLNAWTPVHAYYSVYMSLQAWFSTMGITGTSDDHTAALRTISRIVCDRDVFPAPWSVRCLGHPDLGNIAFRGAPDGVDLHAHVEMLANPALADFWPRFGKMLETTRERRLRAQRDDWLKRHDRKLMRREDKADLAARLFPTTLFDFFWRMRIRANYRDVESFLLAPIDAGSQRAFYEALLLVVDATCLLVQNLIVRQTGVSPYRALVEEVIETNPAFSQIGSFLIERADLIAPVRNRTPRP